MTLSHSRRLPQGRPRAVSGARGSALALRWLPPPLRTPSAGLWKWTAAGAVVRLVLLPIGITTDTLAVYWRAHLIAFDGTVYREYLVNLGAHLVHAAWLRVAQPFLGPVEALWTDPWWWSDSFGLAPQHLNAFLSRDDVLRAIALLKTPYMLADVAAGLVLLWLVWGRDDGRVRSAAEWSRTRVVWIFWMLSPVGLYATLVFGRYESFPVLAMAVALLLAERGHRLGAAVAVGLAITLRTYPVVLVPVFALVLYRDLPRQLGWTALALAPFAASIVASRLVAGSLGEVEQVGDYSFAGNWLAFAVTPERGAPGVILLPGVLLGMMLLLLGRQRGWWTTPVAPTDLWIWVTVTHLALFAFAQFSPHYLMWVTPAVVLLIARSPHRGVVPLHLLQAGAAFAAQFVLVGGSIYTGTLGGLGPSAMHLIPFQPVLDNGAQLASILWTAMVVATVAMALPLLRPLAEPPRGHDATTGQRPRSS